MWSGHKKSTRLFRIFVNLGENIDPQFQSAVEPEKLKQNTINFIEWKIALINCNTNLTLA